MAEIIWTEPALDQLDEIGAYIALDNPSAARDLIAKVFKTVDRLERFPNSGRVPPELPGSIYREIVCSPCRVFYRKDGKNVLVLHVMRDEMELRKYLLNNA
jgi:plasmid stabilization system protein ParE